MMRESYSYPRNLATNSQRPLRHNSTASNNSSLYSSYSRDSLPDRPSTVRSSISNNENFERKNSRLSTGTPATASTSNVDAAATYGNVRRALKPLENGNVGSTSPKKTEPWKPIQPRNTASPVPQRPKTSSGPVVPSLSWAKGRLRK